MSCRDAAEESLLKDKILRARQPSENTVHGSLRLRSGEAGSPLCGFVQNKVFNRSSVS